MFDRDTDIGGPREKFPVTSHSVVRAMHSNDEHARTNAFNSVVAVYWKPVYKYVRRKWQQSNEDAKDATQGFFARAFEKEFFKGYDSEKASFRTFLRTCLDHYVLNEMKAASRLKRAGDAEHLSLDFETAEGELLSQTIPNSMSLEDYFQREWVRSLFELAVEDLKNECARKNKTVHYALFERYDLDAAGNSSDLSYDGLAVEFGLSTSNVTNYLAYARREFRRITLEKLREVTASDLEFRREARQLLGVTIE
jgi:RNA polymerase sigma factor (sigma-70 family)